MNLLRLKFPSRVVALTFLVILLSAAGPAGAQEAVSEGQAELLTEGTPLSAADTKTAAPGTSPAGTDLADKPHAAWKGQVELGVIETAGNTRSRSIRGKLKMQYEQEQWRHGFTVDTVRIEERGVTTAEQYTGTFKSDRKLTERSYLFAGIRYEADQFAGYRPRVSESAGYGRRFRFGAAVRFEAEAGAGGRHTWYTDQTRKSEAIMRAAAKVRWKTGATSEFTEEAFTEIGEQNVHSESQTSLTAKINADFSLRLNITVKHDTVVPEGRNKTDRITSVTVAYDL